MYKYHNYLNMFYMFLILFMVWKISLNEWKLSWGLNPNCVLVSPLSLPWPVSGVPGEAALPEHDQVEPLQTPDLSWSPASAELLISWTLDILIFWSPASQLYQHIWPGSFTSWGAVVVGYIGWHYDHQHYHHYHYLHHHHIHHHSHWKADIILQLCQQAHHTGEPEI